MTKRIFDIVMSLLGLIVLGPFLLAMALWIKLDSKGPVFFRGVRVGRAGKAFKIFKFRSMVLDAERIGPASTSQEDPRVTAAGRFMRKFKIDELPQLLNVLVGQMSHVGPRPEVQKFIDMYSDEEKQILNVRPGITDWASVWNADEAAILAGSDDPDKTYLEVIRPTKLKLQLDYARNHSLWIDIKILFCTFWKIFKPDWLPAKLRPYGHLQIGKIEAD
ncbi:MAG: sugar transferase [Planctomycetota bacterium]|jgi:lipopolysaccharide/colanic/teichoic acid biosynthesis glycosyltransferase